MTLFRFLVVRAMRRRFRGNILPGTIRRAAEALSLARVMGGI
jgi:hypothetical protein